MSTSTVTIEAWIWLGGTSTNYSDYQNWQFGPLAFPTVVAPNDFNNIIGVVTNVTNGAFTNWVIPQSMPVLSSDLTVPLVRMYAGSDTSLTIQTATFTTDLNIGDFVDHQAQGTGVPAGAYSRDLGTAVVNLDASSLAGAANVGFVERGVLNVSGLSSVETLNVANSATSVGTVNVLTGADFSIASLTTLGPGQAAINNEGAISFQSDVFSANATASINNSVGGSITLGSTVDLLLNSGSDQGVVTNEAGATLIKTGLSSSSINWDVVNNGLIDVQVGSLDLNGGYTGNGTVNIAANAFADFDVTLTEDVALNVTGDGTLELDLDGNHAVTLSGAYTIGNSTSSVEGQIVNAGAMNLATDMFAASAATAIQNTSGNSITLGSTVDLLLNSGSDQGVVTNEAGATLIKTGLSSSSINWDVVNNGLIDVQVGSLDLNGGYTGNGTVNIAANAFADFDVTLTEDVALNVTGDGTLELDLDGNHAVTLSGAYTIGNSTSSVEGQIVNAGAMNLATDMFAASAATAIQNTSGNSITLGSTVDLLLNSGSDQGVVTNEAGATLIKTGLSSSSINWDVVNNGLIDVQVGSLDLNGGYTGNGTVNIAANAFADFDVTLTEDVALNVTGDGTLELDLDGNHAVTLSGAYTIGNSTSSVEGQIVNAGAMNLATDMFAASAATAIQNTSGNSITLGSTVDLLLNSGSDQGVVTNEAGATLIKTGLSSSSINWDVVNNGLIDVQVGSLDLNGGYTGNGTVNIAANALRDFDVTLTEDVALNVTGDGTLELDLDGNHAVTLSGAYTIGNSTSSVEGQIVNAGAMNLATDMFAASAATAIQNTSGNSITLGSTVDLLLNSGSDQGVVTNEAGATLIKTGLSSSSINWDVVNNGLIDVQVGSLDLNGGYTGNGTVNIAAGASFSFGGAVTDDAISVTGGGTASLDGRDGNDTLNGGSGNDIINGDGGDDVIEGGAGADQLNGGINSLLGDTLSYAVSTSSVTVSLASNSASGGDAEGDTISGFENLIGSSFDDRLTGNDQGNLIEGRLGNDTLDGGGGSDTADYASGSDNISANLNSEVAVAGVLGTDTLISIENLIGGTGNDTVFGSAADNTLEGGAGDDLLAGQDGNDVLLGGLGVDALSGGNNDDTLDGGAESDRLFGNAGNDSIDGGAGDDFTNGGGGNDTINGGDNDDNVLVGGAGEDSISGDGGSDGLNGSAGNDTLMGGVGDDRLFGGDGDDSIMGGDNDDTLGGLGDNDELFGGGGIDGMNGGGGDDLMLGGAGDDRLFGGTGADTLEGGTGNDLLVGQAGIDTYVFEAAWGNDEIASYGDVASGQARVDEVIDLTSLGISFAELTIQSNGNGGTLVFITADGSANNSIDILFRGPAEITQDDFLF